MADEQKAWRKDGPQRRRARLAWLIGAPLGGLALGLLIPAASLETAEQGYRDSVSTKYAEQVLDSPAVYETTTVEATVTVHPVPQPTTPQQPPVTAPLPNGGKPDYGSPVRDYCKGRFPTRADQQAYALCVNQTSGGTVEP